MKKKITKSILSITLTLALTRGCIPVTYADNEVTMYASSDVVALSGDTMYYNSMTYLIVAVATLAEWRIGGAL